VKARENSLTALLACALLLLRFIYWGDNANHDSSLQLDNMATLRQVSQKQHQERSAVQHLFFVQHCTRGLSQTSVARVIRFAVLMTKEHLVD